MIFDIKDYGGFQKLPVGNDFSDKFALFSILSQINFLPGIPLKKEELVLDELSKMRL